MMAKNTLKGELRHSPLTSPINHQNFNHFWNFIQVSLKNGEYG